MPEWTGESETARNRRFALADLEMAQAHLSQAFLYLDRLGRPDLAGQVTTITQQVAAVMATPNL